MAFNPFNGLSLALIQIQKKQYDTVVSDFQMPEMNGIEFLKKIRTSGNTIPFIIFTGKGRVRYEYGS
jgi:CheY-like chemotaxis protein